MDTNNNTCTNNNNSNSKSCQSSGGELSITTTSSSSSNNNREECLRYINKLSHKISKPTPTTTVFKKPQPPSMDPPNPLPAQPQHQPPVYNINKSDFRDVVQKLTGSPASDNNRPSAQPKAAGSSRLQRIRPPPLAHVTNRPPPMISGGLVAAPLSPLPPLPAVHASAESPVSAYMRYLHSSTDVGTRQLPSSGFSPRWSTQQQQGVMLPPHSQFQLQQPPSPPIPFGCFNSPRSPYPLLSPSLLLSPSAQLGFPQLPLSPTVPPMPSPTWRGF